MIHTRCADDGNGAGGRESLRIVVDKLNEHGSAFGHNVIKCYLITKSNYAKKIDKNLLGLDADIF